MMLLSGQIFPLNCPWREKSEQLQVCDVNGCVYRESASKQLSVILLMNFLLPHSLIELERLLVRSSLLNKL